MAIFQLFDQEKKQTFTEIFDHEDHEEEKEKKSNFFSTLITRFCFLLLLVANTFWFIYNIVYLSLSLLAVLVTGNRILFLKKNLRKSWLHFRRSLVCGLSLFIGLFNPPFGIMIACTYFLMYDKSGMEEVVPAPLQAQFKDIFHT